MSTDLDPIGLSDGLWRSFRLVTQIGRWRRNHLMRESLTTLAAKAVGASRWVTLMQQK